jgi:hypothetical protein
MAKHVVKKVLAIDIGIKNMALCILEKDSLDCTFHYQKVPYCIHVLDKFSIGEWGNSADVLVKRMTEMFHTSLVDRHVDAIVIEKQVSQNATLRQLQFALQGYFYGKYGTSKVVAFQSGLDKLKLCDQQLLEAERKRLKSSYRANKCVAQTTCIELLKETSFLPLVQHKKGDDVSDALLHALYYLTKSSVRKKRKDGSNSGARVESTGSTAIDNFVVSAGTSECERTAA